MARIIDNPNGRRAIRLTTDDILMIVTMYQQRCNCKEYTYDEVRDALAKSCFYLPEDM
ncbi:MAG: hypothetical protein WCK67_02085 [bacterium]